MSKVFVGIALFVMSLNCSAGELVRNAYIMEVANTSIGGAEFAILVNGGTGICAGPRWITFPDSRKVSVASYNQAFAIALAALASDKRVRIHNFVDDSCVGANFISVSK